MDVASRTKPPRIWLGYNPRDSRFAELLQLSLQQLPITILGLDKILPGMERAKEVAGMLSHASGAVLLLSAEYLATQWTDDAPLLLEQLHSRSDQREDDGFWLIMVLVRDCIFPPELAAIRRSFRLPRDGKGLAALGHAERTAVSLELARLVAAQCGMPEPDDRHRSAVRAYREKLRAELERLPFRGLAGFRHPEQARSPRLSALYVAPNLRLLRPSATIAEQWQEIERQLLLPGLSPDERWHLGRRQYALVERLRQDEYLSPDKLLARHPHSLIYGKPGSGKTTLLRHLALQGTEEQACLPVLVPLSKLIDTRSNESLRNRLLRWLRKNHEEALAEAFCERMAHGRALLLLDGLDEVPEAHRPGARRAVEELLASEPALRCVITSRLGPDCDLNATTPQLELADLNKEQIEEFVHRHTVGLAAGSASGGAAPSVLLHF